MPELPRLPAVASLPLSVVLLARNQAPQLEVILASWVVYLNGLDRDYEVIVVDDGSTDGTGDLAEKQSTSISRLKLLRHPSPRGEGAALRTGLAAAQHPLVFYTLCDPHYQPADLGRFLQKRVDSHKPDLEIDHVHLLSAARGGRPTPLPWRIVGQLWRLLCRILFTQAPARLPGWLGWQRHLGAILARLLFGVRYHDVGCPFRLLRREVLPRIPLQSDGPFAHVELMAKANYLGLVMGEEISLEPGHYPPLDHEMSREERRQLFREAWRVIRHPDFGPVKLESPEKV
jgi:glycosyltransferase involved in cell wall biosynthesis